MSSIADVFVKCHAAIRQGILINRAGQRDKEFAFQDWFSARLSEIRLNFDEPGRNTYPDFRLVDFPEGYEVKGLAVPGRNANYDCNSQLPCGNHRGRRIYYIFGRYPKTKQPQYPVLDLVICDGDFLNADHNYVHKNKNVKGFGSFGDIMIRDRKMYVAPTPYALADGTQGQITLIARNEEITDPHLRCVGSFSRVEVQDRVVGYSFNLMTNEISRAQSRNPSAGSAHHFQAFRHIDDQGPAVTLAALGAAIEHDEADSDEDQ